MALHGGQTPYQQRSPLPAVTATQRKRKGCKTDGSRGCDANGGASFMVRTFKAQMFTKSVFADPMAGTAAIGTAAPQNTIHNTHRHNPRETSQWYKACKLLRRNTPVKGGSGGAVQALERGHQLAVHQFHVQRWPVTPSNQSVLPEKAQTAAPDNYITHSLIHPASVTLVVTPVL